MEKIIQKKNIRTWLFAFVVVALIVVEACISLRQDQFNFPTTLQAGVRDSIMLPVRIEPVENREGERLVIAVCFPKSWKARENIEMTGTSNYNIGIEKFVPIPEQNLPVNGGGLTWSQKLYSVYGSGPNIIDEMEWIAFQSENAYSVTNNEDSDIDIKIKFTPGIKNIRVKLGFFVNVVSDGVSGDGNYYADAFTDCINVENGEGDVIDYCEFQLNANQPLSATKDDIVTIKYQGDVRDNLLDDESIIYLCAAAVTEEGDRYESCGQDDKHQMLQEFSYSRTFSKTLWPRDFFDVPAEASVYRIEYSFTNADGSKVLNSETGDPYTYTFSCD